MFELIYEGFVINIRIKRVNKNDEFVVREINVLVEFNYLLIINIFEIICYLNSFINESNIGYNL